MQNYDDDAAVANANPRSISHINYKKTSLINRLFNKLTEYVIPYPETYLEIPNLKKHLNKYVAKKVGNEEAAFLDKHKHLMRKSTQETLKKMFTATYQFYFNLSPGMKIMFLCVAIFIFIVFLPTILGAVLTIMDSKAELIRFVTLLMLICMSLFIWIFVSI